MVGVRWQRLDPDDGVDDRVDMVVEADGGQRQLRCSSMGTTGYSLHRCRRSIRFRAVPDHIAEAIIDRHGATSTATRQEVRAQVRGLVRELRLGKLG